MGTELQPDVDDTDGLDPALEFDEWRARELARLLRDKKAQAERDAEQEEIERRRALPEEQRMAEDMAFADQTRAREKGQMGFMQKYYHRGVFHAVSLSYFLNDDAYNRVAMRKNYSIEIIRLPRNQQWICRCYQKSCKSRTLERYAFLLSLFDAD